MHLAGGVGRGRQQRHALLRRVTADASRHVVLVTATPHSGNEEAFRSLLGLLKDDFTDLPVEDLDRAERDEVRRRLARHFVQRRRADIRRYLEIDTTFPERMDKETTYSFSPGHRALFDDILAFAREYVSEDGGGERRRQGALLVGARVAALRLVEPRGRGRDLAEPGRGGRGGGRRGRRRGRAAHRPRPGRR